MVVETCYQEVGYSGATAGQIAALDKALSRLTINTENAAQAQRMATASLEASAKAGQSAGVAIENFKKQMEGAASYVGTQRSHVTDAGFWFRRNQPYRGTPVALLPLMQH